MCLLHFSQNFCNCFPSTEKLVPLPNPQNPAHSSPPTAYADSPSTAAHSLSAPWPVPVCSFELITSNCNHSFASLFLLQESELLVPWWHVTQYAPGFGSVFLALPTCIIFWVFAEAQELPAFKYWMKIAVNAEFTQSPMTSEQTLQERREVKIFSDEGKLGEYVTSRPALKEGITARKWFKDRTLAHQGRRKAQKQRYQ